MIDAGVDSKIMMRNIVILKKKVEKLETTLKEEKEAAKEKLTKADKKIKQLNQMLIKQ